MISVKTFGEDYDGVKPTFVPVQLEKNRLSLDLLKVPQRFAPLNNRMKIERSPSEIDLL